MYKVVEDKEATRITYFKNLHRTGSRAQGSLVCLVLLYPTQREIYPLRTYLSHAGSTLWFRQMGKDFRDERGGAWSRLENEGKVQPRKKTGKEGEMKQKKEDKKSDEKRREGNKE